MKKTKLNKGLISHGNIGKKDVNIIDLDGNDVNEWIYKKMLEPIFLVSNYPLVYAAIIITIDKLTTITNSIFL